jgi:2-polyprenyl-6-methoxyphenol hydroxylase-like FAD-dependent oxidoreductase
MTKALIIGGGIAGPVAAMALQRVGIEAVVHEAYDRPADHTGFFLNTASNGLDALKAIDIDLAARADGHPMPRLVFWSGKGKHLGDVANGIRLADGTVSVCLKRGLLQKVLREEALARGIPIEYGKRLASYDVHPGGVTAMFTDGTKAGGDLLIGADGIHSATRRLLDPSAPAPSYTGLIGTGGYSRVAGLEPTPDTQHFVFGKRAFFGYLVRESGEIYWFANLAHPDTTSTELAAVPTAEWRRRLLDLFAEDMPLINKIIENSAGEIGAHPVHDIPTSPVWSRGPVVLIGDAGHATSPSAGQGASIACEDAIILARCLRDLPEPTAAFAAYERLRRERVEKIVAYARKRGSNKTAGPVARVFRDLMMPIVLKHFASEKAHAWMYEYHIDWDERVTV